MAEHDATTPDGARTRPSGERAAGRPDRAGTSFADVLSGVRWEYDPTQLGDDALSPLATTERWFRDFPWEGNDDAES